MIDIRNYGKGALKTPKVVRDKHFRVPLGALVVDWSQPYSVENGFTLAQRDQKSSSSCTAQASMYYCEALDKLHQQGSARYNYSQSFMTGGGAFIWKAMSIPLVGVATPQSVPDGDSSEATMEDSSLNGQAIKESLAEKYAVIPRSNIDQMASTINMYGGFVTGFNGRNDMFSPDGTANVFTTVSEWGHAVYVCGYEMHNGKKCLKFKNSWTSAWGSNGYGFFPEDFVNSGLMFDCYVYADVKDIVNMLTAKDVQQLQALEGYSDPAGVTYWTGKTLEAYLAARLPDKVKTIQSTL